MATPPSPPGNRTPPLPDEEALVARAVAGDRTAFAQLVEHYQSACYGLAWRLIGRPGRGRGRDPGCVHPRVRRHREIPRWNLPLLAAAHHRQRELRHPASQPATPVDRAAGSGGGRGRAAGSPPRRTRWPRRRVPSSTGTWRWRCSSCRRTSAIAVVLCDVYGMDYLEVASTTTVRARDGEVAHPPRPASAPRADGRAPGTLRGRVTSGPMTMHDQIHPDDERLAALAGGRSRRDARRRAGGACRGLRPLRGCSSDELQVLRAALGELPDLVPSRPLRLIPALPEAAPATGWLRRLFTPVLVAGSALVLVGAVGLINVDALIEPRALQPGHRSAAQLRPIARSEAGEVGITSRGRQLSASPELPTTASASEAPTNDLSPARRRRAVHAGSRRSGAPGGPGPHRRRGGAPLRHRPARRLTAAPRSGQSADDHRGDEDREERNRRDECRPAGVAEGSCHRRDGRGPPGRRDRNLARRASRLRGGARLLGAGAPACPGVARCRRGRPRIRPGRRPVAGARGARRRVQTVVLGAQERRRQDAPGVVDPPHPLRDVLARMQVRVELLREPPAGARDLERARVARDAENRVGIDRVSVRHVADDTATSV